MINDLIPQRVDGASDGMLPTTSCSLPSSSGISSLLAAAFGGGTNSTAMLCGFMERGIVPDLILFADTGSEMPETYAHVLEMDTQCRLWWGKGIETVAKLYQGQFEGLEKECLRGGKLPALAYGSRACSMKYKHEPQNRRLKAEMKARGVEVATRAIGFDAMESHRNRPSTDKWAVNWYPLMEWGWTRADCIEANATTRSIGRGLGGEKMRWEHVESEDEAQAKLWDWLDTHDESPTPCGCYDG